MSQENVEIVRATFNAWNAGDLDALRELYDPDVLMRTPEGWPEPGPFLGREATMRWFEQSREAFDADALEPISDFIDAADRVVVSQENVEVVRKALEAFEQGGLDATLPFYDREVTWEEAEDEPEAETYQGHDGLRALVGKWLVPFDDLRVEPEEFIDAGEADTPKLCIPLTPH
jgi:ketosteroid isomerase-like protein